MTRDNCIRIFEDNIARVTAQVPADRLHVQELGDDWGGLCAFLGVDVPDTPFPRSNAPGEFETGWPSKL